jgi:signal transduction histidine kinase
VTEPGHGWDRWQSVWHGLFYLSLGVPTGLVAFGVEKRPADITLLTVSAAAAIAGWYLYWVIMHPQWLRRPTAVAGYLAVLLAGVGFLLTVSSAYFFLVNALFPHFFILLPKPWRYSLTAVFAVVVVAARDLPAGATDPTIALIGNLGIGLVLGFFINAIGQQAQQTQGAADRLKATEQALAGVRAELAGAEADNEGLHEQMAGQEEEAGGFEQRQRRAGEIHDRFAHGLAAIVTQLEAASRTPGSDPIEAERRLEIARRLARDTLADVRRTVTDVRPDAYDEAQLPSALVDLTERWSEESSVPATMATVGYAVALHPEVEVTLVRVCQAALLNVATHAVANKVGVTLSYTDDEVSLDIRDDGVGFVYRPGDLSAVGGGRGLNRMRQQMRALGGDLTVETVPGQGTALRASVPLA